MDLELLTEAGFIVDLSQLQLSEAVTKSGSDSGMYITLPASRLNKPTANGRIYTNESMAKALVQCKEAMLGRRLLCSVNDHPNGTHVAPGEASHLVVDAWIEGDILWNKWYVLNTENGRNLRALVEGRAAIPTSIRGLGRMTSDKRIEDYQYLGTDGVGNPAAGTYALIGSEGVKVEVFESVSDKVQENKDDEVHNTLTKFGYKPEEIDPKVKFSRVYNHDSGYNVYRRDKHNTMHFNNEGHTGKGYSGTPIHKSELFKYLLNLHGKTKESGTISEYNGIQVSGIGIINQNSVIQYKGRTWRVSNISGSTDRWQMTLYDMDPMNQNTSIHLFSTDVKNPAQEITIVKESGVKMNSYKIWLEKISEASEKLQELKKLGSSKDQMKHIATFEFLMSEAEGLSGDHLKELQELWDKEKVKQPVVVSEKVNVEEKIIDISEALKTLTSRIDKIMAPDNAVVENEQKMAEVMKSAPYSFDDGAIRAGYEAWTMHRDDPKSFVSELTSQLSSKYPGVNFRQLFNDLGNASGDYTFTGTDTSRQNIPESAELSELEGIVTEFCDRIENGELLQIDKVQEILEQVVSTCRKSLRESKVREVLALEMLTDLVSQHSKQKKLAESGSLHTSKYQSLWEASQVIINQLRLALIKKEGKILSESLTEDKKVYLPGTRVNRKIY